MKILMVNKFLYPNGGSETYIFKLGEYLSMLGHQVEYFGMEHEGRCVGNRINAYTSNIDFHGKSVLSKLSYPIKIIYSKEARVQIRKVLDDFKPEICHINNFNFQLTPSIIIEIRKYEKDTGRKVKIIYTAHDSQLVCPNHLMQNPVSKKPCIKCLGGHYKECIKGKCIHNSTTKSVIAAIEAWYWNSKNIYDEIDTIICPSKFLAEKLQTNKVLGKKIKIMHNFVDKSNYSINEKKEDYILYFGRYSHEKGISTLISVIDELPEKHFVFAGEGPLVDEINKRNNIVNRGFLSGRELQQTIASAKITIVPSECFENCPFTVMESQIYGTPVIGSFLGGIPELILVGETGELFESGNKQQLKEKILEVYDKSEEYSLNCKNAKFDTVEKYTEKLLKVYKEK